MNNKKVSRRAFAHLRRRLFFRVLALAAVAAVCVLLIREAVRGRLAEWIVNCIVRVSNVDRMQALMFYYDKIRGPSLNYLIGIVILVFMVLLFWLQLRSFQAWFLRIVEGIDQIVDGQAHIELPAELKYVEEKLNHAQRILRQREQQTQLLQKQKDDLIVYLAHDIRTPLTSVIGYLSLLEDDAALTEEQRRGYTHIAWEKANRLEQMVDEFFELTRYRLQEVPLNKDRVNLCYMLVQLSDELYPQMEAAGKTMENNVGEDIELWGDTGKLARAFNNILKNAITYGMPEDAIRVCAWEDHEHTFISFRNGGSIPPQELEKIFEKFYRADPARTSYTGGTGLGLAIARDIIVLHGGSIRADSAAGETVFTVTLPRYPGNLSYPAVM